MNRLIRSSILHQKHANLRMKMLNRGREITDMIEEGEASKCLPPPDHGNYEERVSRMNRPTLVL
jgi:hypothetical protein